MGRVDVALVRAHGKSRGNEFLLCGAQTPNIRLRGRSPAVDERRSFAAAKSGAVRSADEPGMPSHPALRSIRGGVGKGKGVGNRGDCKVP